MIYPDNGISFSAKKCVIKPWKDMGNLNCVLLSERNQNEKATHCMILTTWHSGKGKTVETIKRSVVMVEGGGKYAQVEHRGFLGQWNTLYDIIMKDICHCTFIQTHWE